MKEALSSSETSALTRVSRRNISEYAILHSHRRENLKSYTLPGIFFGVEGDRCVRLTTSSPSVSRLSRTCGSLDASQSTGSWRHVQTRLSLRLVLHLMMVCWTKKCKVTAFQSDGEKCNGEFGVSSAAGPCRIILKISSLTE
jgi:hypothetical protein